MLLVALRNELGLDRSKSLGLLLTLRYERKIVDTTRSFACVQVLTSFAHRNSRRAGVGQVDPRFTPEARHGPGRHCLFFRHYLLRCFH